MKFKSNSVYQISVFIVVLLTCLAVIYLHLYSYEETQKIYLSQTEKVILNIKKDFLRDTVNNIFLEIDGIRETRGAIYKRNTENRLKRFQEELNLSEEEFIDFFITRFEDDINANMWTAFLWDDSSGKVLYDSSNLYRENLEESLENIKSLLSSVELINKGNIKGVFGVSKTYIDESVKQEVAEMLRGRKCSNDSYIWINEVINYEGGKNYAIRRVHPNLVETEGIYLSTDAQDIKGNLPYLIELEGVKEKGEIFYYYYFKELNSLIVSEKISYAKLYKDYNWIIGMGVHLNDIIENTEQINNEIDNLSSEHFIRLLKLLFTILLFGFTILYFINKLGWYSSTRFLVNELNLDTLTKAFSRRYGEMKLKKFFKEYKLSKDTPAIMMFDVDDFKSINDKYGHKAGDLVLEEIVYKINYVIRSYDMLVRWGGDEFLGIFPGLKKDYLMSFGNKILTEVSSLQIPFEDELIKVTVSIGFSSFEETDIDYSAAIKRADDALYRSKAQGRNKVNII